MSWNWIQFSLFYQLNVVLKQFVLMIERKWHTSSNYWSNNFPVISQFEPLDTGCLRIYKDIRVRLWINLFSCYATVFTLHIYLGRYQLPKIRYKEAYHSFWVDPTMGWMIVYSTHICIVGIENKHSVKKISVGIILHKGRNQIH